MVEKIIDRLLIEATSGVTGTPNGIKWKDTSDIDLSFLTPNKTYKMSCETLSGEILEIEYLCKEYEVQGTLVYICGNPAYIGNLEPNGDTFSFMYVPSMSMSALAWTYTNVTPLF